MSIRLMDVVVLACLAGGCATSSQGRRTVPSYDAFSGRLVQLGADQNGGGRINQWTYLDGSRVYRGEADADGDGRIDRWEYFDANSQLTRVGTSSANDGVEDTWTMVTLMSGEGRIDRSVARDRHIDRHEYYVNSVLVRVELDTNGDGRVDRWDRYEQGVLRDVQFDTTFAASHANRRLLYDAQGRFARAEADDDGDGRFERVVTGAALQPPGEFRR